MDPRPYFFVKIKQNWCFIATESTYESNMIPIEVWEGETESYKLCRVAYTHSKATICCSKASTAGMMEGPDIYTVLNSKGDTIVSIWKPSVPKVIEIATNFGSHGSALIDDESTLDQIRSCIFNMCGIDADKVKITNPDHIYYNVLNI